MAKNKVDLSIVVVNFNGTKETLACIKSLYEFPPACSFEVILVDNRSDEPVFPMVLEQFPETRTCLAPKRQGFSRNYNLGIQNASGDYIMILNNDTLVTANALDKLLEAIASNPNYGMVGPMVTSPDGSIQPDCARSFPSVWSFILFMLLFDPALPLGKLYMRFRQRQVSRQKFGPVPCILGAAMVVSREASKKVGTLDEGYTFYFEDVEWCNRFQQHGYQIFFVPDALIIHHGDISLSKVRELAKQSEYKSALRYFRQHNQMSYAKEWIVWFAVLLGYIMRFFAFWLIERFGCPGKSRVYTRLVRWILNQTPRKDLYTIFG